MIVLKSTRFPAMKEYFFFQKLHFKKQSHVAAEKSILEVVSEKTLINISSGFKFSNKNPCVFLLVEAIPSSGSHSF